MTAEITETIARKPIPLRSRYIGHYTTTGGTPFSMEVWNPTVARLAHHLSCGEDEIDIREDDETGDEIVSVDGKPCGKIEWF